MSQRPPAYPPRVFFNMEIRHLLDDAAAGIRRSQRAIAARRITWKSERFCRGPRGRAQLSADPVVAGPASPASPAFAHELDCLRSLSTRSEHKSPTRGRTSGWKPRSSLG